MGQTLTAEREGAIGARRRARASAEDDPRRAGRPGDQMTDDLRAGGVPRGQRRAEAVDAIGRHRDEHPSAGLRVAQTPGVENLPICGPGRTIS